MCLCRSSSCAEAAITRTSSPPAKLGTFLVMDVSSTLGGPRIFYTGGDTCSDGEAHCCMKNYSPCDSIKLFQYS